MNKNGFKIRIKYDSLVWILLVWCSLQDFVLSFFFKITGAVGLTKIIFYSKDVITIILFALAMMHLKLPRKISGCILVYYLIVFLQVVIGLMNGSDQNITSILSSTRGVILLPTMMIIGFAINNKQEFLKKIKKYYCYLVFFAIIGIIELIMDNVLGTKTFWIDFLEIDNFHDVIKGQPDLMFAGVPWNWHTSGKLGNMSRRRLISLWAAPLTAGAVLLMPCMYYSLNFLKKRKFFVSKISKTYLKDVTCFLICCVALFMTVTRQIVLPYIGILFLSFIYYNKKNRRILIVGSLLFSVSAGTVLFGALMDYINNGSTMAHIAQIQKSIQLVSFWGNGVGTFGTRFLGTISTESQYITVLGQLGVIPLFLYLIIFMYPIKYCKREVRFLSDYPKIMICSLCFSGLIYCVAGIASETVAAFTSMAQYYIFIGLAWGYCEQYEKEVIKHENKGNCNVLTAVS